MAYITQELQQGESTPRVTVMQTDAFSYLLEAVAEENDVGFFNAPSEQFCVRAPVFSIDEDVVLAIVIAGQATINWYDQLQDWLIPFNAADDRGSPVQTMLSLGNGPLAIDFVSFESMLERVKQHLVVAYILPGCVGIVKYRWNAKLRDTMSQLHDATIFYESVTGRVTESDSTENPFICLGEIRSIYGRMRADGSIEFIQ